MLAIKIQQKDGVFYFVNYRAEDVLDKVRFMTRFYLEGEETPENAPIKKGEPDEIVEFISKIERSDRAFQRGLIRRKVRDIRDFYKNASEQPLIPGAILLYTPEKLDFKPLENYETVGNLTEPMEKFYIIDGQHRLAGLYF
ncbi:MAG: hypothetical protein N3F63_08145, partial [Thermoplasmata archaeon]|nr:hypothetical protein [Thermoplasmata archaeon]